MLVGVVAGLLAIAGIGYGAVGVFVVLFFSNSGFVGEGDFYASILLLLSLAAFVIGGSAGFITYLCWVRLYRR
jgi:hypothetical protein